MDTTDQQARPVVAMPPLCNTHRWLLVHQCGYARTDPWVALEVATQVALFQGATCDAKVHAEIGGDVARLADIGCLACRKPDLFGKLIHKVQRTFPREGHIGAIKALGERWVADAAVSQGEA